MIDKVNTWFHHC